MTREPALSWLLGLLIGCGSSPSLWPDTIYHMRSHGAIDLAVNPNAHHCSERVGNFHDAYRLEDRVQTIQSIAVSADALNVVLRDDNGPISASYVIEDADRVRAFWYYDDWTLAMVLDHGSCRGNACSAEISLIKYNGAKTPTERPNKLCFERWVGTLKRSPEIRRSHP